jgi:DnaK suppressor protein
LRLHFDGIDATMKKNEGFKKAELEEFRVLLETLRARLQGDVTALTNRAFGDDQKDGGAEPKSPMHMAELGTETFEQDFALSLVVNEQETLMEIDAALQRIKSGAYGLCEECLQEGKDASRSRIPRERLQAIPYTRQCVHCARKAESR